MNQVAIDPKAVIERMTADALLAKKIGEVVKDPAKFLPRHRGFLTLMMTSGEIVSGVIKIATHQVLVFVKEGDIRTTRIEIGDIADFEI